MNSAVPKQYLKLAGRTVIEHVLERLAAVPRVAGIVVAIAADDAYWNKISPPTRTPVMTVNGGVERYLSVLRALEHLEPLAQTDDWVLVHDAARPCVRHSDIECLMDTVIGHGAGGLLGLPVRDTMKRVNNHNVVEATVDRDGLWHALTPQMFRLGELRQAIRHVVDRGAVVSDDASAMEMAGHAPLIIEGHADNIKITRPQDLLLAELYLQQQGGQP